MRILLCWPNAEMSIFDVATGIRAGLLERGHDIVDYRLYRRFKLAQHGFEAFRPNDASEDTQADVVELCYHASEALVHHAIIKRPDWVFIVCGMGLHPDAVLALKIAGFNVAAWFTEAPYNTTNNAELYLVQFCDVAFVNERTSVHEFQAVLDRVGRGGRAYYLPHAYNPAVHRPALPTDARDSFLDCDVLLVGTGFEERQFLLECVDWSGIDLRIAGFWPGIVEPSHLRSYLVKGGAPGACVPNWLTAQWYRQARIVLNPHRTAPGAESANPRTYEAAACRAFQISDYRAEVEEKFGDSVPTYQPGVWWQLAALVRRYLADHDARRRCAETSYNLVREETFAHRADAVVAALEEFSARRKIVPIRQAGEERGGGRPTAALGELATGVAVEG